MQVLGPTHLAQFERVAFAPSLLVMPAGPPPPNPTELVRSDQLKSLLQWMLAPQAEGGVGVDVIVIDTPPAAAYPEAAVLSAVADSTLIVVDRTKARVGPVQRMLDALRQVDGRLAGVVINRSPRQRDGLYYSGEVYLTKERETAMIPALPRMTGAPSTTNVFKISDGPKLSGGPKVSRDPTTTVLKAIDSPAASDNHRLDEQVVKQLMRERRKPESETDGREAGVVEGAGMKLLIVDRDRDMVEMLSGWLKSCGYGVARAYTAEQAIAQWQEHTPDLVLLDPELDTDTLALCRRLLAKHDALLLVMSMNADVSTRIHWLSTVADGFVIKPFLPGELLAHIAALSRRARATLRTRPSATVTVGRVSVDATRRLAVVDGVLVRLTRMESKLLHLLAVNANEVCTSEQIVTHVWGYDDDGSSSLVKTHIRRLREKVESDPSNPRYVLTVPGVGYMLARLAPSSTMAEPASGDVQGLLTAGSPAPVRGAQAV